MEQLFGSESISDENDWISFSDLMAVMMVIFLFLAIIYFDRVPKNTQQIIAQKIQLEKDLVIIKKETQELTKLKIDLEVERKEIMIDLEKTLTLKKDLENKADQLSKVAALAVASQLDAEKATVKAEQAAEVANAANTKFAFALDNFKNIELEIYQALLTEFKDDLGKWDAELIRDNLIFRFKAPEVLFPAGESQLTNKFEKILSDFIPRYVLVLRKFTNFVEEVRVEGHTSSEYTKEPTALGKYIANMNLSQDRTRSVTEFSLLSIKDGNRQWLQERLTANGLSSSKLIYNSSSQEDRENSRRVEFTVRTAIRKILIQLEKITN